MYLDADSFMCFCIFVWVFWLLIVKVWRTFDSDLEEAVDVFLRSVLRSILQAGVSVLPHHAVDGVHYIRHLLQQKQIKKEKGAAETVGVGRHKRWGVLGLTSLVMQPSLLRSYRLKTQLSLSVMEPRRMMDRLRTRSCSKIRQRKCDSKKIKVKQISKMQQKIKIKMLFCACESYFKADQSVVVGVKSFKQEMCVHARIYKNKRNQQLDL